MSTTQTFQIPTINMSRLRSEIERLNKRAERLKLEPITLTEVREYTQTERDSLGFEYDRSYVECAVSGQSPQLSGWKMVAAIEPQANAENLIREVPGETCPAEYRTTDLHCDHCHTTRRRNAIYVLHCNEDDEGQVAGEHRQVGRNCMADFLGHENPESILGAAETLWDIDKVCRSAEDYEWGFGPKQPPAIEITRFVTLVAATIRKCGWVSRSKAEFDQMATADIAFRIGLDPNCSLAKDMRNSGFEITEADTRKAREALEWGRDIDPQKAHSTFMHNLGVGCRQTVADHKTCGTVAALLSCYDRERERQLASRHPTGNSEHIGELKERRVFKDMLVMGLHDYETDFGPKTLCRFRDPDGNVVIWRTGGKIEWIPDTGQTVSFKATISKHTHFGDNNPVAQTIVSRAVPVEED